MSFICGSEPPITAQVCPPLKVVVLLHLHRREPDREKLYLRG